MIKEAISQFLYRKYNTSFSQCGEDVILANLFSGRRNGFFVDIGAFHPYKFSNTYLFYKKGWSGINIDAAPGSMDEFKKLRPRDTNLETAISDKTEELTYYFLGKGDSMNSFSLDFIKEMGAEGKIKKTIKMTTQRLEDILEQHAKGKEIDFMSMDVEGLELSVLRSGNWKKYRPKVVVLESFDAMNRENNYDAELRSFFDAIGYRPIAKTTNGIFFLREDLKLNQFNHIL
jgi:FkbM family methyltransferase